MAAQNRYHHNQHSSKMALSSGCLVTVLEVPMQGRELSFVSEQSGAPIPTWGLIILITRHPELSAISELDHLRPQWLWATTLGQSESDAAVGFLPCH